MPERRHAGEKMEGEYHQANFRFVAPTSGTPSDIFLVSAPFDVEDSRPGPVEQMWASRIACHSQVTVPNVVRVSQTLNQNCPLCFLLTPHETGQARGRARHQRWPKLAPASVQLIIRRPYPRDFPQGFSGATGGGVVGCEESPREEQKQPKCRDMLGDCASGHRDLARTPRQRTHLARIKRYVCEPVAVPHRRRRTGFKAMNGLVSSGDGAVHVTDGRAQDKNGNIILAR
ncbi:uncharacterized protein VDAG_05704 [Verticillium dahliae VdLs.17]|uniref:Uncharacterized protein n=1 Tax=Verticillium dahliae (strain VdLs.17 / ATCC MYA-4575 / FGSC 10137) TaxID=498257 RepID=G2X6C2_VERDV|nr:uncharacterized protein VDAG_05704 [Verticillium dahliae VdLs.17]EGY14540.1 hypothetical protein VDAG_05704 [Verticillium dahliae VdLs.17]